MCAIVHTVVASVEGVAVRRFGALGITGVAIVSACVVGIGAEFVGDLIWLRIASAVG